MSTCMSYAYTHYFDHRFYNFSYRITEIRADFFESRLLSSLANYIGY